MTKQTSSSSGAIGFFTRHPNAANLLMVLMILFGVYGLLKLNTQFFPTIEIDTIRISIVWPGASAEDVEANILKTVEPEVRFLDGLDKLTSYAREGSASLTLEFVKGTDMQKALADVEQAISGLTTLPEEAERPVVSRSQLYETVAKMALSGPFSEESLQAYARFVRDRLIANGIDKVDFEGLRQSEIHVDVDALALRHYNLSLDDISAKLRQGSLDLPSGSQDGLIEKQVRVQAQADDPQALRDLEIRSFDDGRRLLLGDLASVQNGFDERDIQGFSKGQRAIELTIQRTVTSDTLQTQTRVEKTYAELQNLLPASLNISLYDVRASRVKERIALLVENGLTGLALVVLILFLFLNGRVAFWVAAGIPVALMAALGFMYLSGQSINMISLFALIMTLGIIVDDAIVVGEHTATRFALGDSPYEAAERGAGRMFFPVIAAMATTAAAFFPILLISDTIGQIMGAMPLVVLAVLAASLIECFLILPGHLAHSLKSNHNGPVFSWRRVLLLALLPGLIIVWLAIKPEIATAFGFSLDVLAFALADIYAAYPLIFMIVVIGLVFAVAMGLETFLFRKALRHHDYEGDEADFQKSALLRQKLDHGFVIFRERAVRPVARLAYRGRYVTLSLCMAGFMLVIGALTGGHVGFIFFPSPEAETIRASVFMHPGTSEKEAIKILNTIETSLYQSAESLSEGSADALIESSFITLGKSGFSQADNVGRVNVELTSSEIRTIRTRQIVQAWRSALPTLVGVQKIAISERRAGPPGRDLDIRLTNGSPEELKQAALVMQKELTAFAGVSGIEDDLPYGKPEVIIALNVKGASLGLTSQDIGNQVRNALSGAIARRLPGPDDDIPVKIRLADTQGLTVGARTTRNLSDLDIQLPSGDFIPLGDVATLTNRQGFSVIMREGGRTMVSVTADVDFTQISNDDIVSALQQGPAQRLKRDFGVDTSFSGRAEEQQQSFADLRLGVIMAMAAIYIILAWVFASYAKPFAVMLIIPFGLVGAVIGHMLLGFPLTILSLIGLLGLSGILVNDSIILVSRYSELRQEGNAIEVAAIQAACDRTRAVLLTSLTTVGGLLPLLFEKSLQAQFLMPMAITIVFGLAVATVFVLFLVPALLGIGHDISQTMRWIRGRSASPRKHRQIEA
jgi:multidrug efflux pump subunit AcrB